MGKLWLCHLFITQLSDLYSNTLSKFQKNFSYSGFCDSNNVLLKHLFKECPSLTIIKNKSGCVGSFCEILALKLLIEGKLFNSSMMLEYLNLFSLLNFLKIKSWVINLVTVGSKCERFEPTIINWCERKAIMATVVRLIQNKYIMLISCYLYCTCFIHYLAHFLSLHFNNLFIHNIQSKLNNNFYWFKVKIVRFINGILISGDH